MDLLNLKVPEVIGWRWHEERWEHYHDNIGYVADCECATLDDIRGEDAEAIEAQRSLNR